MYFRIIQMQAYLPPETPPRRQDVVPPQFPERGHNFSKKVQPGNSSYASRVKFGKSVLLVGDSMVGRIKVREFNNVMKESGLTATMRKKFFPGGKAKELAHYITPTLEEQNPDVLILNVGTNNLQDRDFNATNLAADIIAICQNARDKGVNTIFVSSIVARKDLSLQRRLDEVNRILENECKENGFFFISNENILHEHLCNDGIHLLDAIFVNLGQCPCKLVKTENDITSSNIRTLFLESVVDINNVRSII